MVDLLHLRPFQGLATQVDHAPREESILRSMRKTLLSPTETPTTPAHRVHPVMHFHQTAAEALLLQGLTTQRTFTET